MAPNWIPLCRSMQVYCEPFFASINNWRAYENEEIMRNRIELIQTASSILHNFSQKADKHEFDLVFEHDVPLLPEVHPTAGKDYIVDGDQIAFKAAMKTQPKVLFHKGGVYFQDNLLKGIAGWSAEILPTTNVETRATIIAAIEKLFRIPESAGMARFVYVHIPNTTEYVKRTVVDFPTVALDQKGDQFFKYLQASRKPNFDFERDDLRIPSENVMVVPVESNNNKKKRARNEEKEDEWEADADGVMWTRSHHSIGSFVAAHFPPLEPQTHLVPLHNESAVQNLQHVADSSGSKLFRGKVTKYAPPSAAGLTDQLYHIKWEDGDEQDFDEIDIQRGMDLYDQIEGWTTRHPMIGIRVAAYFPMPVKYSRGSANEGEMEQVLFCGSVTKFGRALTEDDVALYHVVFDDGDEQDFSEHELQMGIKLYNLEGIKQGEQNDSNSNSKDKDKSKNKASSSVGSTSSKKAESPAVKKVKTESTTSNRNSSNKVNTKNNSIAAVLAADCAKQAAATKTTTTKTSTNTTTTKGKKNKNKGKQANKHTKNTKSSTQLLLEEVGEEEGEDDPVWSMKQGSVFKRVAQRFLVPGGGKKQVYETFGGTVVAYAPPTAPKAKDQLYHIVWDDGDEQDFDEDDLKQGLALLEGIMPTPLYVASAAAKAHVAKRQQELVVDYDFDSNDSVKDSATMISSLTTISHANTTTANATTTANTNIASTDTIANAIADTSATAKVSEENNIINNSSNGSSSSSSDTTTHNAHSNHSSDVLNTSDTTVVMDPHDMETQAMDMTAVDMTTFLPTASSTTNTTNNTTNTTTNAISDSPPRGLHNNNIHNNSTHVDESNIVCVDSDSGEYTEPLPTITTTNNNTHTANKTINDTTTTNNTINDTTTTTASEAVYDLTQGTDDGENEEEEDEEVNGHNNTTIISTNTNNDSYAQKDSHSIADSVDDWADTMEMTQGP